MIEFARVRRTSAGVELTPLIDVVFQLLVFFLLTSAFIHPGIAVNLPSAASADDMEPAGVSIVVAEDGRVYIADVEVSLDAFQGRLLEATGGDAGALVAVFGDTAAAYGRMVQVVDLCRRAGLERVLLMLRPEQDAGSASEGGGAD